MSSSINVSLIANDLISPIIGQLQSRFGVFGTVASGAISAAFNPDPVSSWVSLATTGLEAVFQVVDKISEGLKDASRYELDSLNGSVGLSSAGGIALTTAKQLTQEMQKQAAIAAAALPGDTGDYIKTGQAIGDSVVKAYNIKTEAGVQAFQKSWGELTQAIGFVAATSKGSGAEAVNRAFDGFISGSKGFNELRMYDDVAASPLFKTLESILEAKGIDSKKVKNLSVAERVNLILEAKSQAMSGEIVDAYANTVDGIQAKIKSYLFDQATGVFGFSRLVAAQGGRSVLDSYKDLLSTFLNISDTIGDATKSLGLSVDPMAMLIGFFDWVNDSLLWLKNIFTEANPFKLMTTDFGMAFDAAALGRDFGVWIGKALAELGLALTNPMNWLKAIKVLNDVVAAIGWFIVGIAEGVVEGFLNKAVEGTLDRFKARWEVLCNPVESIKRAGEQLKEAFGDVVNKLQSITQKLIGWLADLPGNPFAIEKPKPEGQPEGKPSATKQRQELTPVQQSVRLSTQVAARVVGSANPLLGLTLNALTGGLPSLTPKPKTNLPTSRPAVDRVKPLVQPKSEPKDPAKAQRNTYNVNIQANTNADPQEIAREVMGAISGNYTSYKQNSLAM